MSEYDVEQSEAPLSGGVGSDVAPEGTAMQTVRVLPDLSAYPSDDSEPIGVDMQHFRWIQRLEGAISATLGDRAFVGGDLYWFPIEGDRDTRRAPDILVAFGRPPGDTRTSYFQWIEAGIAPQIVFEVISPSNSLPNIEDARQWYERYGVEDFYLVWEKQGEVERWSREGDRLVPRGSVLDQWLDRLDLRIVSDHGFLRLFDRTGLEFTTYGDERLFRLEAMRQADLERFAREGAERAMERERQIRIEAELRLAEERQARETAHRTSDAERRAREVAEAEISRLRALLREQTTQ